MPRHFSNLRGDGIRNVDMSLSKEFNVKTFLAREDTRIEVRAEAYNAWNHTNLAKPDNSIDSSTAGVITDVQYPMRRLQLGLHVQW